MMAEVIYIMTFPFTIKSHFVILTDFIKAIETVIRLILSPPLFIGFTLILVLVLVLVLVPVLKRKVLCWDEESLSFAHGEVPLI